MFDLGHITEQELTEISAQPVAVAPGADPPNGCIDAATGGFFCAFAQQYLTDTLGVTPDQIANGGLTIQTTLRPDMQVAGDQAVLNTLPMGDPLAGMYSAVEPGTGHVLAMSVNRRFGCSDPDCESVILNAVASQGAGSTYKVFVAAAALAEGYSQNYTITTSDPYTSKVFKKNGGTRGEPYTVGNAGNYPATLDLRGALIRSSNTYFLALEDALGSVEQPVRMAQAMGLHSLDSRADDDHRRPAGVLHPRSRGDQPARPGQRLQHHGRERHPVRPHADHPGPRPERPAADEAGRLAARRRRQLHARRDPPGRRHDAQPDPGRRRVQPGGDGHAGRGPGSRDRGQDGNVAVEVLGGLRRLHAAVRGERDGPGPEGGPGRRRLRWQKPATIWHDAMAPILTAQAAVPFPPADPTVQNGNTQIVPSCSSVSGCESALQAAGFQFTTREVDSDRPDGALVGTSPPAGSRAVVKQVVTIQVSNGSQVPAPAPEAPAEPPAPEGGGGAAAVTAAAEAAAAGTAARAAEAAEAAERPVSRAAGGPLRPRDPRRPGRRRRPGPRP